MKATTGMTLVVTIVAALLVGCEGLSPSGVVRQQRLRARRTTVQVI